jgi:hypothetical protein
MHMWSCGIFNQSHWFDGCDCAGYAVDVDASPAGCAVPPDVSPVGCVVPPDTSPVVAVDVPIDASPFDVVVLSCASVRPASATTLEATSAATPATRR